MPSNPLRNLPSVHELLESPAVRSLLDRINRNAVVSTVKNVLEEVRHEVWTAAADRKLPSAGDLAERIARRIVGGEPPAMQSVVHATGQLLGNGLGGPPLADEAIAEVVAAARDYANLDFSLATGDLARREADVECLLRELTGAEAATVVTSNAGALRLALSALCAGRETVIARGHLLDIDDALRVPEVISASGATLREVGAVNVARLEDYVGAMGDLTGAILSVHVACHDNPTSNGSVTLESLAGLGRERRVPLLHLLDDGAMIDLAPFGIANQPTARDSVKAGADLVLLSGDKLLGGPSCGIVLGRKCLIEKIESNPFFRVLRTEKLTLAALAETLRLYRDPEKARFRIPLLQLLSASIENLQNRAERLAAQAAAAPTVAEAVAVSGVTRLQWGLGPAQELPTWRVALRPASGSIARLAESLRLGTPPVVAKIEENHLFLDLRSIFPRQDMRILEALDALGGVGSTESQNSVQ